MNNVDTESSEESNWLLQNFEVERWALKCHRLQKRLIFAYKMFGFARYMQKATFFLDNNNVLISWTTLETFKVLTEMQNKLNLRRPASEP